MRLGGIAVRNKVRIVHQPDPATSPCVWSLGVKCRIAPSPCDDTLTLVTDRLLWVPASDRVLVRDDGDDGEPRVLGQAGRDRLL